MAASMATVVTITYTTILHSVGPALVGISVALVVIAAVGSTVCVVAGHIVAGHIVAGHIVAGHIVAGHIVAIVAIVARNFSVRGGATDRPWRRPAKRPDGRWRRKCAFRIRTPSGRRRSRSRT
jgi:hypothetical protein